MRQVQCKLGKLTPQTELLYKKVLGKVNFLLKESDSFCCDENNHFKKVDLSFAG